jgi:hypothetical protein
MQLQQQHIVGNPQKEIKFESKQAELQPSLESLSRRPVMKVGKEGSSEKASCFVESNVGRKSSYSSSSLCLHHACLALGWKK